MELEELLKAELETDSLDFTEEEATSAIETSNGDDFVAKATAHLKGLLEKGVTGTIKYQRKKRNRINYEVVTFGDHKAVFKMAWLS